MDSQVSGIFRGCIEAIDAGVLIELESSTDKEFHFQNWFRVRWPRSVGQLGGLFKVYSDCDQTDFLYQQ